MTYIRLTPKVNYLLIYGCDPTIIERFFSWQGYQYHLKWIVFRVFTISGAQGTVHGTSTNFAGVPSISKLTDG